MNGIEPEFCLFFQQILPFDTLQELNLSSNWFGTLGLERFKEQFKQFKQLRVLNLGNLRPYLQEDSDRKVFRNVLDAVKDTLTELHIHENAITEDAF